MCTLTYIPLKDQLLICSNRDEIPERSNCKLTKTTSGLIYPKEPLKGGSWICAKNGQALVLLNGAFEKHLPSPKYAKSRGLLLLEIAELERPIEHLKLMDLKIVEPFTVVCFSFEKVEEFRWDGEEYTLSVKDPSKTHLWSSATLYTKEAMNHRNDLFKDFSQYNQLNKESQWEFHTTKSSDLFNGIVMKRTQGPQTISTTQIILEPHSQEFKYYDHISDQLVQL